MHGWTKVTLCHCAVHPIILKSLHNSVLNLSGYVPPGASSHVSVSSSLTCFPFAKPGGAVLLLAIKHLHHVALWRANQRQAGQKKARWQREREMHKRSQNSWISGRMPLRPQTSSNRRVIVWAPVGQKFTDSPSSTRADIMIPTQFFNQWTKRTSANLPHLEAVPKRRAAACVENHSRTQSSTERSLTHLTRV